MRLDAFAAGGKGRKTSRHSRLSLQVFHEVVMTLRRDDRRTRAKVNAVVRRASKPQSD